MDTSNEFTTILSKRQKREQKQRQSWYVPLNDKGTYIFINDKYIENLTIDFYLYMKLFSNYYGCDLNNIIDTEALLEILEYNYSVLPVSNLPIHRFDCKILPKNAVNIIFYKCNYTQIINIPIVNSLYIYINPYLEYIDDIFGGNMKLYVGGNDKLNSMQNIYLYRYSKYSGYDCDMEGDDDCYYEGIIYRNNIKTLDGYNIYDIYEGKIDVKINIFDFMSYVNNRDFTFMYNGNDIYNIDTYGYYHYENNKSTTTNNYVLK